MTGPALPGPRSGWKGAKAVGEMPAAFSLTALGETERIQAIDGMERGNGEMIAEQTRRSRRGQTRQEMILILAVCAVALIATLSVFVPPLRHMWLALGRALIF
jgi:Flp pilus assembly pilin Flp